jgi:hypothetical protein
MGAVRCYWKHVIWLLPCLSTGCRIWGKAASFKTVPNRIFLFQQQHTHTHTHTQCKPSGVHCLLCYLRSLCKRSCCLCGRASYMEMLRCINLMQQLWFIIINISTCLGIYMPIFRSTGCMLLHMVFSTGCCTCGPEESVCGLVHCV